MIFIMSVTGGFPQKNSEQKLFLNFSSLHYETTSILFFILQIKTKNHLEQNAAFYLQMKQIQF